MKVHASIFDMFARIKNNTQNYKKTVFIKKTKPVIVFLKFLYKEGFILNFKIINERVVIIFLKYYKYIPLLKKIYFFAKNKKEILTNKLLLHKNKELKYYILYTKQGYMSLTNAQLLNIGGQLICEIY
jgi:ribosomal protein S8